MQQHALDDAVGAPAVLGDLFEIAGQHRGGFFDIAARVLVERRDAGRRGLLQLVEQLDRQCREVVDEIERVLDLVRDPGGQLPQRGHFCRVDHIGLRRLQFLVCLAQFLLAAALLVEQPGVAHGQRRLGGKGFDEFDGLRGKIAQLAAQHDEPAEDAVLEQQRHREEGSIPGPIELVPAFRGDEIGRVRQIGHLDRRAGHGGPADRALAASHRIGTQLLGDIRLQPVAGAEMKPVALGVVFINHAGIRAGEFDGAGDHHAEHGLRVERRADGAADARAAPRSAPSACRRSRIVSRKARSVRAIAAISSGPPDGISTPRLPALRPFIAATSRRSGTAIEPRTSNVSTPPTSTEAATTICDSRYSRGRLRDDAVARRYRLGAQLGDDRGEQFVRLDAVLLLPAPAAYCRSPAGRRYRPRQPGRRGPGTRATSARIAAIACGRSGASSSR